MYVLAESEEIVLTEMNAAETLATTAAPARCGATAVTVRGFPTPVVRGRVAALIRRRGRVIMRRDHRWQLDEWFVGDGDGNGNGRRCGAVIFRRGVGITGNYGRGIAWQRIGGRQGDFDSNFSVRFDKRQYRRDGKRTVRLFQPRGDDRRANDDADHDTDNNANNGVTHHFPLNIFGPRVCSGLLSVK